MTDPTDQPAPEAETLRAAIAARWQARGIVLPAWAALAAHQVDGAVPRIDVDAAAMYAAWLAELAANPPDPAQFPARIVAIRNAARPDEASTVSIPAMTPADAACDPARPTQYWLEVAFQCMKMDLQLALRSFTFEIRVHDADKEFQQAKFPAGRGIAAATWGKEAREHFRRLRGVVP